MQLAGSKRVQVPLGEFADGGVHTVRFTRSSPAPAGQRLSSLTTSRSAARPRAAPGCVTLGFESDGGSPLAHGQDLETPGETFGCLTIAGGPTGGPARQVPDLMVGEATSCSHVLTKSGDFYVLPDDDHEGGTWTFTFCEPALVTRIDLIDIDDAKGPVPGWRDRSC